MGVLPSKLQHTSAAGQVAQGHITKNWVPIKEEPVYTPRRIRLICVGAGFSGLTLAHKIKHEMRLGEIIDYVIYERNHDVGGTWLQNKYPGVACDVPAHAYTFLFEPNPNWSQFYAPGSEIQDYIKNTVRKWNLDDHIEFNSCVVESLWDESIGKWKVKINQNGTIKEDEAEILASASGCLTKPRVPNIEGIGDFKGKLSQTADWDDTYDWKNKRVAVIGNGASGIQTVTAMHSTSSKLVNYVRSPCWISPNFSGELTKDGNNFSFTEAEKRQFREDPKAFFEFRKKLENSVNGFCYAMLRDHPFNKDTRDTSMKRMQAIIKNIPDPSIAARMIPDFHPGCRRLTPGHGYLEAFTNPNTQMCWEPIERITETGIKTTDGQQNEFDIIVCATGFDTTYIPQWKLIGRNNTTLTGRWKHDPEAFFSVHVDNLPNYFMIMGPNFLVAHGSLLAGISFTCDYILKWARKIGTEDIKSIDVKKSALDDYNVWTQEYLKRTAWSDPCRSWYKNGKSSGQVTAPYGGTTSHFKKCLENMGGEHFNIEYNSANRFRFLGNGQVDVERNGFGDLAEYFVEELW
ncbi:flavin-containing monooxygenase [Aspergillus ibericus CBS 121593]|uniref:Putative flavo protein n=1 Tax=Aspergillus ibericus CBS 121593 TaxID=1448316 RepID=A0A395H0I4_9EURO|nr:putative flavo protein [Aspergillus ibericus CBS 121593]RAL01331.1 putative flavo protein [Aspergillus ibericus CBS 121593]